MYSRRFYGGDRTQKSRVAPAPQPNAERAEPIKKMVEQSTSEALPIMAIDIPTVEESEPVFIEYTDPKDFLPKALRREVYIESEKEVGKSQVAAHTESTPEVPTATEAEIEMTSVDAEMKEESPDTLEDTAMADDVVRSVRNMTFEDMVLTGLLMLGSSGEYDDDIMLMLGLILMIGA